MSINQLELLEREHKKEVSELKRRITHLRNINLTYKGRMDKAEKDYWELYHKRKEK